MSGQVEEIRLGGEGPELYARLRTSDQEAPTIVLLSGLGFHTFEYEPLAEALTASGYNVLSFDYRGHGHSDGPRGRWSLADLASDAIASSTTATVSWPVQGPENCSRRAPILRE